MIIGSAGLAAGITLSGAASQAAETDSRKQDQSAQGRRDMGTFTTKDGTSIFYKDWGSGRPVVFSHGWPLSSDAWEDQMVFLAERGYRCIAHERRGHGRSGQPWSGNDMDTTPATSARCSRS